LKTGRVTPPYFSMSAINEVILFARDYVNHPSARTRERKTAIRQALLKLTGQKLGDNCGTCYIEAIFKIINITKMANYELKKGYVAQFEGQGFRGIKAFTNTNLKLNPAKYEPIAEEYLRLHPERAIYFVKIPKLAVKPRNLFQPRPVVQPIVQPENPIAEAIKTVQETIDGISEKPKRSRRKPTKRSD